MRSTALSLTAWGAIFFCALGGLGPASRGDAPHTGPVLDKGRALGLPGDAANAESAQLTPQPTPNTQPSPKPEDTHAVACMDRLVVNVLPFEVTEDHTKSVAEITQMGNGETKASLSRTLTIGHVYTTSSITAWNAPHVVAATCAALTLTVGYKAPVLRVARDLSVDRCSFLHVYRHEQEHVRIYQAGLATMQTKIEERFKEALDRRREEQGGVLIEKDGKPLADTDVSVSVPWDEGVKLAFNAAIDVMGDVAALHAKHDGPQSYAENNTACNGRVRRLTTSAAANMF